MFTAKRGGRSLYGYIEKFIRLTCQQYGKYEDLALVRWFPPPQYPDGDPLLVRVNVDFSNLFDTTEPKLLYLDEIDPSRVMYELEGESTVYMMRIEGIDVMGIVE